MHASAFSALVALGRAILQAETQAYLQDPDAVDPDTDGPFAILRRMITVHVQSVEEPLTKDGVMRIAHFAKLHGLLTEMERLIRERPADPDWEPMILGIYDVLAGGDPPAEFQAVGSNPA